MFFLARDYTSKRLGLYPVSRIERLEVGNRGGTMLVHLTGGVLVGSSVSKLEDACADLTAPLADLVLMERASRAEEAVGDQGGGGETRRAGGRQEGHAPIDHLRQGNADRDVKSRS